MGAPKKPRKKYEAPFKHWDAVRIKEEGEVLGSFGLKNKREIWKVRSFVKKFREAARKLFTRTGAEAELEKAKIIGRLHRLGLLEKEATLDDVLGLTMQSVLGRRLQTIVYQKGLAHTAKQARQLIVHGHINIGERTVTIPSHIVTRLEEDLIQFNPASDVSSPDHPIRTVPASMKAAGPGAGDTAERNPRGAGGREYNRPRTGAPAR